MEINGKNQKDPVKEVKTSPFKSKGKKVASKTFYPVFFLFSKAEKGALKAHQGILHFPKKFYSRINKQTLKIILAIIGVQSIAAYLICWLYLDITAPEDITYYLSKVDFNIYAGAMLVILGLFVIGNLFQITIGLYESRFSKKRFALFNVILILSFIGLFLGSYVFRHPELQSHYPKYAQALPDYDEPIEVFFNLPVDVSTLKPTITPEIEGYWEWEPYLGNKALTRKGKFIIDISSYPNQRYVLYISGIKKFTDPTQHEYGFAFVAPPLPLIESTFPENNADNVKREDSIYLKLDRESRDLVEWSFKSVPVVDFELEFTPDKVLKLTPKELLDQGKAYTVTIFYQPKRVNIATKEIVETSDIVKVKDLKFTTVKEPLIDTFAPTGNIVRSDEKIKIVFSEEMNKESVEEKVTIEPAIEGEFKWDDDKTLNFVNVAPLPKDTPYKVKFESGMRSKMDGVTDKEIIYDFKTVGKVGMIDHLPRNGSTYVSEYADIKITFDQPVDTADAQSKLTVTPGVPGVFRWEGNTMVYAVLQPMAFNTVYTVQIAAGIKSIHGLPSATTESFSFTTRSNVYVFTMPIYYQPAGSFSCNIYTAKMVLAYKGFSADATGLIAEIGYDANRVSDSWTGNPYAEYVGNADGSWGYGVYYPPIQNIFAARGISSDPRVGWNVSDLAREVQQGRPVVIWRYNGVSSGANISWTSDDGTYVHAFSGMHGGVVTGFTGPVEAPTSFYLNDPWFGPFWIDVGTFDYYWSFANRMALIVY